MKFELKTENENYLKFFSNIFINFSLLVLIIIFFDIAHKLRFVSRHFRIDYNCRLISVERSKSNYKKLSVLSNFKNKQKIMEFCREFVK